MLSSTNSTISCPEHSSSSGNYGGKKSPDSCSTNTRTYTWCEKCTKSLQQVAISISMFDVNGVSFKGNSIRFGRKYDDEGVGGRVLLRERGNALEILYNFGKNKNQ